MLFTSVRCFAAPSPAAALLALLTWVAPGLTSAATLGWNADALSQSLAIAGKLPVAPAGVTDLAFGELFRAPVGPLGLEFTDKARQLDGQRVRVLGFMVHQDHVASGKMILAPFALTTDEAEYGLCDDLPPGVVSVTVPKFHDRAVPFTPGPLVLIGRLELGPSTESDGRVFHLRMILDNEDASTSAAVAP
ncbi:MAG: hypothetical protein ABIV50_02710 [Opitutus sp.]